jgi:hypothetical protein
VTTARAAVGCAITQLERATVFDGPEYWQALLDDLEPFVDLEVLTNASIAFKYVVALRDRTGQARSPRGRAACIAEATMFLWEAHAFSELR